MKKIIIFILSMLLAGCASKSLNYEPQDIKQDYNATWQYNFNIQELDELINLALKNNEDIAIASLNLHQALLKAGISASDLFPTPSASLGASTSRDIFQSSSWAKGFSSEFALSWELDVFGRIYNAYESANYTSISSQLSLQDVQQSIVNSVISQYFYILYLNEMKENLISNYENMSKLHELIMTKVEFGREETLSLLQSGQNLLTLQNSLNSTNKDLQNAFESLKNLTRTTKIPNGMISNTNLLEYDIGVMLDENDEFSFSWLERIKNRPDVNMALSNLNAAFYDYKIAQKDFLPRINIGGSLSDSDAKFSDAFDFNILRGFVSVSLPFLNFYKLSQNLKISEDEFNKLRLNYEKALNNAVNEAIKYARYCQLGSKNLQNQDVIVKDKEEIVNIYEQKYNAGRKEFSDLLNAKNDLLNAKNSYANMKYQLINDIISFYKASAY